MTTRELLTDGIALTMLQGAAAHVLRTCRMPVDDESMDAWGLIEQAAERVLESTRKEQS